MLRIRCTKKLMKHLSTQATPNPLSLTTTVGDWYANLFHYDGLDIAMCVSEQTRYAIPVSLVDCEEGHGLYVRLVWRIHDAIKRMGLSIATANSVVDQYRGGLIIAPTADRSVLGTMSDLIRMCEFHLDDVCDSGATLNWEVIEDQLNEAPHMPMGGDSGSKRLKALLRQPM